ncbi:related to DNA-directed RNA polymerase, mitochondrial [Saccharomycodes ludwigii]|uniref:DNA-directed RNA polymerase n=1 Tax=Saccharomycodes ludwigii TaxID=36035 RepID=A0A376BAM8_9ASCO|nr:hypothetical protein SCDLUD_000644 [Saccharomycodes ludwigii]KAH3903034.1 hypothetical protein SCDLUD_000644 [Saccharomycodes ludwigii]SSD61639.1 related to DNA-directed RNA polymerase, mitochondrial [Saccharomycodes ludwigii]
MLKFAKKFGHSYEKSFFRDVLRRTSSPKNIHTSLILNTHSTKITLKPTESVTSLDPSTSALDVINFTKSKELTTFSPGFEPFDRTYRNNDTDNATKEVMNLWPLLEACLHLGYLDRAFSILTSLYAIKTHRQFFIDDFNKYLLKYSEIGGTKNGPCTVSQLENHVFTTLQTNFSGVDYNDRTVSVLIHHSIKVGKTADPEKLANNINKYLSMGLKGQKEIMKNTDILTLDDYIILINDLKLVKKEDLPTHINFLFEKKLGNEGDNASNMNGCITNGGGMLQEQRHHIDLDKNVETLDKDGIEELISVDTIGMKVVRQTLLGLSLSDNQLERLQKFLEQDILSANHKSFNFMDIYKSLKTEEEIKQFDNLLEEINHERQIQLERRATDAARERWRHDFEESKKRGELVGIKKKLNVTLWEWYEKMLPLVEEEVRRCQEVLTKDKSLLTAADDKRLQYAPYMILVAPEKMTVITILDLLKLNSTGGVIEGMRTARAVISVAKSVELEFRSEKLLKNESNQFKTVNKNSPEFKMLVKRAKFSFRDSELEKSKILWPQDIRAKMGSILISILTHVATVGVQGRDPVSNKMITGEAPAFYHTYQYHNGSKLGVIKIHKNLVSRLSEDDLVSAVQPQLLPMLIKPRPWKSWNNGGYLYTQSHLIRTKESPEQIAYLKAVSDNGIIDKIYEGVNVLGDTAWTVNKRVFEVMSKVWNTGGDFLKIPAVTTELRLLPPLERDADPAKLRDWKLQNKLLANEFSKNRSMRCDANYKLEIARAFLGEKFYFPHNLDFRGRAYPLSPHFNHLGNDMSRGLLIFWKGKRLGPQGLKWLKIHLANLFGFDKTPFQDRVKYAEEHLADIKDSAEHPIDGKGWWKEADKPWQALATCIELNEAHKLKNPEDYVSHQPVHQDGTCNGLQHYAALGGDIEGATQVNLVPSSRPQDVYAYVAKLVVQRLEKASAKGDEKATVLKDKIKRKVVKQTVMTNVYGVTSIGATEQINKQLLPVFRERGVSFEYSKYLTKHVFASIRKLFKSAHLIQDWLATCAKVISKSIRIDVDERSLKNGTKPDYMTSVIWTTPLGLPIVQPYRDASKKQVSTNLQTVYISDPFQVNPVNSRKQKAGFPPNFIHSLDASHMLLSAIRCGRMGLSFAAVHDSYWTHACDVDIMNESLRDEFIKLHEVDLIERLKNEFDDRYRNYLQIMQILRSSPAGIKLLVYRKKLETKLNRPVTIMDEIYLEKKRREYLASEDKALVDKGKNMETSVSIISQYSEEELKSMESASSSSGIIALTPLKIPDIPPKGDFDVRELKNSKYFFS